MERKYGSNWLHRQTQLLTDPDFWVEFSQDLESFNTQQPDFIEFLKTYNPISSNAQSLGKYSPFYFLLHSPTYRNRLNATDLPPNLISGNLSELNKTQRNQIFFKCAPPRVQLQLAAHFPQEFASMEINIEDLKHSLPQSSFLILQAVSNIRADHRDQVLVALAGYLKSSAVAELSSLSEKELKLALEQAAEQIKTPHDTNSLSLSLIFESGNLLQEPLALCNSNQEQTARAASELVEALSQTYYTTQSRRALYQAASLFWREYQAQNSIFPSPDQVAEQLNTTVNAQLATIDPAEVDPVFLSHLVDNILPQVVEGFSKITSRASELPYYNAIDQKGKYKPLLLHQVEAALRLKDEKRGILADEPGTGKTVPLIQAGLALLDERINPKDPIGRILVVGSKTVIANWDKELALHIQPGVVQSVSILDSAGENNSLSTRLQQLETSLSKPTHDKQIIYVNYDLFRHPDFEELLEQYSIDLTIVDEAHNVKSRFLESIEAERSSHLPIAQRTSRLYRFLRHSDCHVFIATSTPFVKELTETLIMIHLVAPDLLPVSDIEQYKDDPVGTHRLLKQVMIRRTKAEITDLPEKETIHIPIDLQSVSQVQKLEFLNRARDITRQNGPESQYYSILSLEAQIKYPWLIQHVHQLIKEDRSVVIFTPFSHHQDTLTTAMSTRAISRHLFNAGIKTGILDGLVNEQIRAQTVEMFLKKQIRVLAGTYDIAGESITLCSPINRATEVIILFAPNRISQYIQAIDRVHRLGQSEPVRIYVPYVTGDLLGRSMGTYDERSVRRLLQEYEEFSSVIDGLFFVERGNYHGAPTRGALDLPDNFDFSAAAIATPHPPSQNSNGHIPNRPVRTVVIPANPSPTDPSHEVAFHSNDLRLQTYSINESEREIILNFYQRTQNYPRLTSEQVQYLYQKYFSNYYSELSQQPEINTQHKIREKYLQLLKADNAFKSMGLDTSLIKFGNTFAECQDIEQFMVLCNLGLVFGETRRFYQLPMMDLINEGIIGLKRAVERFDVGMGNQFSTYATYWIRQGMQRAVDNTSRSIRYPVQIATAARKIEMVTYKYFTTHGSYPTKDQLREIACHQMGITQSEFDNIMEVFSNGIHTPVSLDKPNATSRDPYSHDLTMADYIADESADLETVAERISLQEDITSIMTQLSPQQRRVLRMRFGLDTEDDEEFADRSNMTLQEVGESTGLTRERIRQIEGNALQAFRINKGFVTSYSDFRKRPQVSSNGHSEHSLLSEKKEAPYEEPPIKISFDPTITRGLIEQAYNQETVWSQLSPRQHSLLRMCFKEGAMPEKVGERLARIYNISPQDINNLISTTLKQIRANLNQPVDNLSE